MKTDLKRIILPYCSALKFDEPLWRHTTFRIGGPAKYFALVNNAANLKFLLSALISKKIPFYILGGGSNILFSDKGFNGAVITLAGDFRNYAFSANKLICGAGVPLGSVVNEAARNALSGLECLAGVPGTVGGAVYGNAGTKDSWIGEVIDKVKVLSFNGTIESLDKSEVEFGYRKTNLVNMAILECEISLKDGKENVILTRLNEIQARRRASQPVGVFCAGSVFKNPKENSAGFLIEKAGLKGASFGGAVVSDVHANFIVNSGSAKADDVKSLIHIIREDVKKKFGVELELEIQLAG